MTIRRMHTACWIPKATNTHSQYTGVGKSRFTVEYAKHRVYSCIIIYLLIIVLFIDIICIIIIIIIIIITTTIIILYPYL
jgi:hypothetical protein